MFVLSGEKHHQVDLRAINGTWAGTGPLTGIVLTAVGIDCSRRRRLKPTGA